LGFWGLGLGLGVWPNPQSPIPNPQSPYFFNQLFEYINK
jgi:hypothetical protein